MYPYYNGYVGNFSLSEYDQLLIKDLYSELELEFIKKDNFIPSFIDL